jgi:hypothetical protein
VSGFDPATFRPVRRRMPPTGGASFEAATGVRLSVHARGKDGQIVARIVFGRDVLAALGWKPRGRIAVLIGGEPGSPGDQRLLWLRPARKDERHTYSMPSVRPGHASAALALRTRHAIPPLASEAAAFEITPQGLILRPGEAAGRAFAMLDGPADAPALERAA